MVGEDGNVYEARGWDSVGAHTYGYNSVGLGNLTIDVDVDLKMYSLKDIIIKVIYNTRLTLAVGKDRFL